jgi:long-chain acyl-CoA synthetase
VLPADESLRGYLNLPEETARAIDADGWLPPATSGIRYDGFLRLTDRKKNLLITLGGKKVSPARIEALVAGEAMISSVVVVGEGRSYVAALVALGAEVTDVPRSDVEKRIRAAFERANANLARFEQVRRVCILPRPLSITEGELTPTHKIRRPVVLDRYRAEIEKLYEKTLAPGILEIVGHRT